MAPYPAEDRAEEHPGQDAHQDTSPAQPPASPPPSRQPAMAVEDEHPGVPLGQATPSQLASTGPTQAM
eukprot:897703-Prorocentrum_lima.AAC.1